MVKTEIMTVPSDFFLSASSIYREVLIWDFLRTTSKHYSFDIFNTLLILLFNTLFTGSKVQEEHNTLSHPSPRQPFRLKLVFIDNMFKVGGCRVDCGDVAILNQEIHFHLENCERVLET